jgi:hypothetical protein
MSEIPEVAGEQRPRALRADVTYDAAAFPLATEVLVF